MVDEDGITEEEMQLLKEMWYGYPQEEEKQNIFSFFKRVISMKDNSKTANLDKDELGIVRIPVRTCQEIELFCDKVGSKGLASYFEDRAQIILSTSLSKEGFLDNLAVTQKREIDRKKRKMLSNSGWFKKKESEVQ